MSTQRTNVVIIGGGQAGLAMSAELSDASIDHVVLERGQVGEAWRSQRWDSLRLLTPNWMTRLPGHRYDGVDPDGYMHAADVAAFLSTYREIVQAPVITGVTVEMVRPLADSFEVVAADQRWLADCVVVATGACSTPKVPAIATALPASVAQLTPTAYRNPAQLNGRTLVVGASASGMQIADELATAGRDVVIAVGDHVRLPRRYRGMDIHWWMNELGLLDQHIDEMEDKQRAHSLPSLQLVGNDEGRTLDLNSVTAKGVQLVGRMVGVNGTTAQFSGSLANHVRSADLKERRLMDQIDEFATERGLDGELDAAWRSEATQLGTTRTTLDLGDIDAVVWATGFRPNYPWVADSLLDERGDIPAVEGVATTPGLFTIGMPFMRTRKSSFIDGVGGDARFLAGRISSHLRHPASAAA